MHQCTVAGPKLLNHLIGINLPIDGQQAVQSVKLVSAVTTVFEAAIRRENCTVVNNLRNIQAAILARTQLDQRIHVLIDKTSPQDRWAKRATFDLEGSLPLPQG